MKGVLDLVISASQVKIGSTHLRFQFPVLLQWSRNLGRQTELGKSNPSFHTETEFRPTGALQNRQWYRYDCKSGSVQYVSAQDSHFWDETCVGLSQVIALQVKSRSQGLSQVKFQSKLCVSSHHLSDIVSCQFHRSLLLVRCDWLRLWPLAIQFLIFGLKVIKSSQVIRLKAFTVHWSLIVK